MFHGSMVALVTPMLPTGAIDIACFRKLVEHHIQEGSEAIVINGTTGEAPTLTEQESADILKIALETARERVPIIMGTGTNCTQATIRRTEQAMVLGADACLVVTPYYNKPTQEGLFQHYSAIASKVAAPIILYNMSGRTGCDLLPATVARLSHFSNIVGIKEGSSDLDRGRTLVELCGHSIDIYSGDDESALAFMLQGGRGVISVTANVAPRSMRAMCAAALKGNMRLATDLNNQLMPLHQKLFVESNPIPVKWALQQMGLIQEGIRLPLTTLSLKYHGIVKQAMQDSGII